ncbi:hypothetical protein B0H17DRAFT_1139668 [Mycena rosella]|uniref:Uncharacterized protein n=1 Tax=Mycena rosella TaxID=1033263 RepID=A0AAD7G889_MYCRO|nr:hypothetical protein B0H17DRAFT_1139668 [Mycena rosella]
MKSTRNRPKKDTDIRIRKLVHVDEELIRKSDVGRSDQTKAWCTNITRGLHTGVEGYVVHILDVWVNRRKPPGGHARKMMIRICTVFPGTELGCNAMPSGWFQLGPLQRHVLSPSPRLHLLDRVHIIGERHTLFNYFGYVVEVVDDKGAAGVIAVHDPECGNMVVLPMRQLECHFWCGDTIVIARGKHRGRRGTIIEQHLSVFEIFDGDGKLLDHQLVEQHKAILERSTFRVGSVDVNFNMSGHAATNPNPTPFSIIPHPTVPIPSVQLTGATLHQANKRAREDDALAARAESDALEAVFRTVNTAMPPETLAQLQARLATLKGGLKKYSKDRENREHVGRRFEGIEVRVAGPSAWKNHQGIVLGDFNLKERVDRLASQNLKRRWNTRVDTQGIMVTMKEQSGHMFTEEIGKLVHDAPPLSTNKTVDWGLTEYERFRLEGKADGRWLCIPGLVSKRIDVIVQGIGRIVPTRHWKPSPLLMGLDNKIGYLLLDQPILPDTLESRKITVYAVGKNHMKHDVPRQYIKPLRDDGAGTKITMQRQRVVVLGRDMGGGTSAVGKYAETCPDISHPHEEDVVAVMVEGGTSPQFFHILRLSRAINIAVQTLTGKFPATIFA